MASPLFRLKHLLVHFLSCLTVAKVRWTLQINEHGACGKTRVLRNKCEDLAKAAQEATLIAGSDLRSDMKDLAPSCFHSASRVTGNADAAPEGGA